AHAAPGAPFVLTRRMAYHLLDPVPRNDLIRSLRRAQVLGLGGSGAVARAVGHTRLARELWEPADERWWLAALQWLAGHPTLGLVIVEQLVDYLHARRFGDRSGMQAPDPVFNMAGRSPRALIRLAEEWEIFAAGLDGMPQPFPASGLRPGRWEGGDNGAREVWTMDEIRDTGSLLAEARAMRHCVATYAPRLEAG